MYNNNNKRVEYDIREKLTIDNCLTCRIYIYIYIYIYHNIYNMHVEYDIREKLTIV